MTINEPDEPIDYGDDDEDDAVDVEDEANEDE